MIGNPLKVKDIISEMSRGGIRIPEIQRSYVWKRAQIAKLLDSIYRGFPTGSLLLWDTTQEITSRDMSTNLGKNVRSDFVMKIVLDGQQRITSLGRIFDSGTSRYDRIIFNIMDEVFEPYSPRNSADPRWIDITQLLTEEVTELDVLDRLMETKVIEGNDRDARNRIHERLKKLAAVRDYQFPVEIVRDDDLEVVTEIFIRVNSGGTRLREAELALARLAWKLPGSIVGPFEKMEDECNERGFDLDARFLMRSLVSTATRQSRFRDLKAFWARPVKEIEQAWIRTENGLRLTLDFVEGNVGIPGSEFLPSVFSLIPLTIIFSDRRDLTSDETRALKRWFLIANSFSHYVGMSETTLNQDLSVLGPNSKNTIGLLEQALKNLRAEPTITSEDLERAGSNSPFFPLAFLAVMNNGAEDWFRGIKLRRDNFSEDQNVEYHHIFPKKLLDDIVTERYLRDEMANLAFLGQKANRRILKRPPDDYLNQIPSQRLEAQFVPMNKDLWRLDRYSDFLIERRKLLATAMNRVLEA